MRVSCPQSLQWAHGPRGTPTSDLGSRGRRRAPLSQHQVIVHGEELGSCCPPHLRQEHLDSQGGTGDQDGELRKARARLCATVYSLRPLGGGHGHGTEAWRAGQQGSRAAKDRAPSWRGLVGSPTGPTRWYCVIAPARQGQVSQGTVKLD